MDFWGDAIQASTAFGGLATIGVAAFGYKLWKSTGQLADETRRANALVAEAAWLDAHERLRPRFGVSILPYEDRATLSVRVVGPDSLEWVDELRVSLRDTRGNGHGQAAPRRTNWQFGVSPGGDESAQRTARLDKGDDVSWTITPGTAATDRHTAVEVRGIRLEVTATLGNELRPHVWTSIVDPFIAPSPPPRKR